MCFVPMYLLLFLLMVMIGKVEPGRRIPLKLCSGEDFEMQMNDNAVAVYAFYNGRDIAISSNVSSMEWDISLPANYEGRLSFKNPRDITVTLTNVSYEDKGLYQIVTKSSKGIRRDKDWLLTVLVPPTVKDAAKDAVNINIIKIHLNDSCSNLTCGNFLSLGKPKVYFKWNVSDRKEQTITVCGFHKCQCHAVGPAMTCLTSNLSAECCESNPKSRRRRSLDDKPCSCDDSNSDDAVPGTDPINPVPIVPIVLGVLAPITAIAVTTVIIVFYKRRSTELGVQAPAVHYEEAPMEENQDM